MLKVGTGIIAKKIAEGAGHGYIHKIIRCVDTESGKLYCWRENTHSLLEWGTESYIREHFFIVLEEVVSEA